GSDPIAEPAADEPLTQHAALLYLEWKHGKSAAQSMREAQLKLAYQFYRATGGPDGKVERATGDFETTGEYAALIYGKAPLVFDGVRKQLGDAAYFKALRTYADDNRWRWVSTETVFKTFARTSPSSTKPVEKLRRRWWQELHGDEDIGRGDLAGLLQGSGLGDLQMTPEQLKQLEEAMKVLGGGP
ncbi:MAG: aminopeptidase, partial [Myxococcaceae bacterium]|nr:aminopeptidase [Myxococcaceae bacterium]